MLTVEHQKMKHETVKTKTKKTDADSNPHPIIKCERTSDQLRMKQDGRFDFNDTVSRQRRLYIDNSLITATTEKELFIAQILDKSAVYKDIHQFKQPSLTTVAQQFLKRKACVTPYCL